MATGYKISNLDIDTVLEKFSNEEVTTYKIPSSIFTSKTGDFSKNGVDIGNIVNIPTSSGSNFISGLNKVSQYKKDGVSINAALLGCRPVGIPILALGDISSSDPIFGGSVGDYTIYRSNGKLYYSVGANVLTNGVLLGGNHCPKYIQLELQGAGGGGGGSATTTGAQGGSGGSYIFCVISTENPIVIHVGKGGSAGGLDANGSHGEDTYLTFSGDGNIKYKLIATGGVQGVKGSVKTEHIGDYSTNSQVHTIQPQPKFVKVTSDGSTEEITQLEIESIKPNYLKVISTYPGGWGLARDNVDKGFHFDLVTLQFYRPEIFTFNRGNTWDGYTGDFGCGGGGGPSLMASGGQSSKHGSGNPGTKGSGGSGGGYEFAKKHAGSPGGNGVINIYY